MADFETMPLGTAAAIRAAAELLRKIEGIHQRRAERLEENGRRAGAHRSKARDVGQAASRLEACLPCCECGSPAKMANGRCALCDQPKLIAPMPLMRDDRYSAGAAEFGL